MATSEIETRDENSAEQAGNLLTSSLRQNTGNTRPKRRRNHTVSFREPQPLPLRRYQITILALTSYINFTSNIGFTILASFFDENAGQHGQTKLDSGFIVAIYAGSATIMCPIFGAYLKVLGKKFTLISGLITAAVCAGLFSMLDQIDSPPIYFYVGVCLRAFQAIGTSAYFTATYAVLVEEWRGSKLAFALGIYEAFTGLGMIIGPLLGSLLFKLGGYPVPFYVVTGMLLLAATATYFTLNSDDDPVREGYEQQTDEDYIGEEIEEEFPFRKVVKVLLSNGLFVIPNILMIPVWSCMDFCMPFIGPYLEECGATDSKITVGALFIGFAIGYSVSSIGWGYLCGRFRCSRSLMFFGSLFSALCYFFLGPSPWLERINLSFPCSVMSTSIVMVVLGISLSAAIIPSCSEMVEIARQEGCAEQASNFIAGLMNSLIFFGEFIGPSLGGLLIIYANGDFALGASYFAIYCLIIVLLCGSGYSYLAVKRKWDRLDESLDERRHRRASRSRQFRRRRGRRIDSFSQSFSVGPRSLSESFTTSMRMQWHEVADEADDQNE